MSTERRAALLAMAALLAFVPAPASAQPRADAEGSDAEGASAEEAERLFHEGASLLEEGRYESARAVLERAFTLEPRASTGFNLASALQALGRSWEAHQLLGRLESGELGELSESYRGALDALRGAIAQGLGRIELRVRAPASVVVFVDDERAGELGAGNVLGRLLPPGPHAIRAEADGHGAFEEQVVLEPGQTARFVIALAPLGPPAAPDPAVPAEALAPVEDGGGGVDVGLVVGLTVGAVVVLAAAGLILGLVLADGGASCDAVIGCVEF